MHKNSSANRKQWISIKNKNNFKSKKKKKEKINKKYEVCQRKPSSKKAKHITERLKLLETHVAMPITNKESAAPAASNTKSGRVNTVSEAVSTTYAKWHECAQPSFTKMPIECGTNDAKCNNLTLFFFLPT